MEKRRDIRFWLQHVWFGTLDHAPSPLAEEGGDGPPPTPGEGRLDANPTWPDCAPTPSGRTTLE